MAITCPYCGKVAATLRIGRAATNIGVTEICYALRFCLSVSPAAEELGCSRALIYEILKQHGLTPMEVIKEHATKDTRLLHKGNESD